jgi:hypothetical protein
MARGKKQSAGSWLTPVSTMCTTQVSVPGQQPPPHPSLPALPTFSVNPHLPNPNIPDSLPFRGIPASAPPGPFTNAAHVRGGSVDPLSSAILFINTNPYIIGCFMLILNLGGRFLSMELTKKQEEFLSASWLRPALFFTVVFIATRNIAAAFWVTLLFFAIIWVIANEKSPYCMIPSWCGHNNDEKKKIYENNVAKVSQRPAE